MDNFNNCDLRINITVFFARRESLIITPFFASIQVFFENQDIEEEPLEIGEILAHRFDLSHHPKTLFFKADEIDHDLMKMAEFFFFNKRNYSAIEFCRYLFYIDKVYLKPEFRGKGYALKALAAFLELFAVGEIVCCHPSPTHDLSKKYSAKKGRLFMKKYWSKLGLTNYNQKHNILWEEDYFLPQWLTNSL